MRGVIMKKMKKTFVNFLVCLMFVSVFVGCTQKTPTTKSGTTTPVKAETVRFFSSYGSYKDLLEEYVSAWNASTGTEIGITIEMETNIDNYKDALVILIEAGNAPDIFTISDVAMIKSGWIAPLDDIPEAQETLDFFSDALQNGVNIINGKTYSVPLENLPVKMAYNKDLFVKNGIVDANGNAKPPKTLDEMVEYAKIITKNGGGKEYGYGYTNAFTPYCVRRFILKSFTASAGAGWFDNSKGEYNFAPYAPMFEAVKQMFEDGSVFPGYETISIDAIRAQFAEGFVGMICAPSYDIGVYNNQFPAQCDWGICDPPQLTADPIYKGASIPRQGCVISSSVDPKRLSMVATIWSLLNSVDLEAKLFAGGYIQPASQKVVDYAYDNELKFVERKNADIMSDITYYMSVPNYPDTLIVLEGGNYQIAFEQYVLGTMTLDELIEDLNTRYNAAYQQGIQDGTIDDSLFHFNVNWSR
jgi:multiple sugar transport system substrate-binding protein